MKERFLTAAFMLVVLWAPAIAHETDHFTVPTGRTFADMGRELSAHVCRNIEQAVAKTNRRIAAARSDDVAELLSPDTIALAVMREFPGVVSYIASLNQLSLSAEMQERYPGQIVGWFPVPCVYDGAYLPFDIRQVFVLWRSPIVLVDGVYVGTDKLGHLIHIGHDYFRAYRAALRAGRSEEEALTEAVQIGIDADFLLSEEGLRGVFASGVFSNADLAANFLGLLFYRNLTEPVLLRGRRQPPLLVQRDGLWQLADHVHPESDFFTRFFDHHFDEALNPNLYDPIMRRTIAVAIEARAPALRAWYRDANGAPRARSWFLHQLEELRTYYGVDYGHMTGPGTAVGLASVCFQDAEGDTDDAARLHTAADEGDIDTVRGLLDAGVFVDVPAVATKSPLDRGVTPLHRAVAAGQLSVAQLLLERGAAVGACSRRGVTALHLAVEHPQMVRLLLQRGASADAVDQQDRTPLHWAARAGAAESVAALLGAGADADAVDVDRRTPLHDAVDVGAISAAGVLLDQGADPDAAARYDWRPLHGVATRGDTAMAELLLRHGADTSLADAFGVTAVQVASRAGHTSLVDLFRAGGTRIAPLISEDGQLARSQGEEAATVEQVDVSGAQGTVE